ncbi:MAG: FAD-dependent oxidoreductase [Pseudomonadales bacterium]|nr:FAD-dependent oxidoreductase [Pseudomonadales bacterium]
MADRIYPTRSKNTQDKKPKVTRRELLTYLAATGSSATVLQASAALGLLPDTTVDIPQIPRVDPINRPSVVVLGAGIAGLTAAYELDKAGYDCVILEAAPKAGGRCLTVRSGDVIDEVGNPQRCEFDDEDHLYFNAGPARLPSTHRNMLHYCKELGVELEIFINENKEAYVQDDAMLGGKPLKNKLFTTNARGFMAEIMAKNFEPKQLDVSFDDWEAESLIGAIRSFGDLSEDDLYKGSFRAGYLKGGYLEHGVQEDVVAFKELLKSRFMRSVLNANEGETGPVLFQPVGGMDKIVEGFVRQLNNKVYYNVVVTSVETTGDGVAVAYEHNGMKYMLQADYCFNCIPTHLMTGIANNFSPSYREAMAYVRRGEAYKSAFQTKTRFWEKDDIYGGISWTNQPIRQIWYPPHGMFKQKGIVLSAYDFGGGMHFTKLSQEQRLETAIKQGEKIHPDYRQQVEKGITIAWHRMNHMLGCSARWQRSRSGMTAEEERLFNTIREPEGNRHYMIGDQVTLHSAWQESAVLSAHWAINDMVKRNSGGSSMPGRRIS